MKNLKICSECKGKMKEMSGKTPEGFSYKYYKCNEEVVDMKQLHNIAEKYRVMKKYHVKLSKWGLSLGLRIPEEIVNRYNLKDNKEVSVIAEDKGIKIIP